MTDPRLDQQPAGRPHQQRRGVGDWCPRLAYVRQHAGGDGRGQRHQRGDDENRRHEGERDVTARVGRFAGRHAGHFVTTVGEDEQQRCRAGVGQRRQARGHHPAESAAQIPTRTKMTSGRILPIVKAFTSHDACLMPRRLAQVNPPSTPRMTSARGRPDDRAGPVKAQRQRQPVDHRGAARDAAEPQHPADLEADEAAEGDPGRANRSARGLETAADLGEAQRDQQRRQADGGEHHRPPVADLAGDVGGQQEYCRADHLVDADGGQVPTAQRAPQRRHYRRRRHY